MKKFLSLMLTLALIITTLALPITASAADISLQAVATNKINLTYEPTYPDSLSAVRPGDSFSVNVVANVTEGTISSFYAASFKLQYDAQLFDYNSGVAENGGTVQKQSDGIIHYDYIDGNLTVNENKVVLATLNFNVKDTAFASLSKVMSVNDPDTNFVENSSSLDYYAFSENNLSETQLEVAVENNTAKAFIGSEEIVDGRTYYSTTGVKVTYQATNLNSATITKASEEAKTIPADGYQINETGSYTVAIAVKGGVTKTYSFNVSTADVAALLDLTGTVNDTGYKYGDVISLPVEVSGLDGETADVISFDVDYDKTKFELAVEGAGAVLKAGTEGILDSVVFGETEGDITVSGENKATVATLKFTVKSDIAYGDCDLTIKNAKMALVKSGIDPTADKINIQDGSKTITVVPTGEYVTISDGKKTGWDSSCSGTGYAQKVAVPANVEVKYIAVKNLTEPDVNTQAGLSSIFASASALSNDYMTIDAESNYYIITKVGSVYNLAATLINGTDIFYDATAPNITDITAVTMTNWAKDKTINKSDIVATDNLSEIDKYYYSLDGTAFTEIPEDGYTFAETFNGNITIKVTDKAGNSKTETAVIKVDKTVPAANIEAGAQSSGKKELTITATDDHSGVATTVVSYSTTENGDYSPINPDSEGKYFADVDGWYKVVVTDNVGNTAERIINVTVDKISGTSSINVTVVKNGTAVKNGFLTKEAMSAKGITNRDGEVLDTNGTFTYVNITVDEPKDSTKYENEIQLKTGDSDFTTVNDVDLSAVGDYEVKVITKNKTVADDKAESVYAFSIVKPENMLSVNADKRYNIIDYAYIKKAIGNTDAGVLPTAESGFWGGLFSGDVTGDLTMTSDDLTAIINSLRAGQTPGNYDFEIMNMTQSSGE